MATAPIPSSTLPFGTASAYADSFPAPAPKELTLGAETCFNLAVFKGNVTVVVSVRMLTFQALYDSTGN